MSKPRELIDVARDANAHVTAKRAEFEQACRDRACVLRSMREHDIPAARIAQDLGMSRTRVYEILASVDVPDEQGKNPRAQARRDKVQPRRDPGGGDAEQDSGHDEQDQGQDVHS